MIELGETEERESAVHPSASSTGSGERSRCWVMNAEIAHRLDVTERCVHKYGRRREAGPRGLDEKPRPGRARSSSPETTSSTTITLLPACVYREAGRSAPAAFKNPPPPVELPVA